MAAAFWLTAADAPARVPQAQPSGSPAAEAGGKIQGTIRQAGHIVMQPVRDVGVAKTGIPQVLVSATKDPYGLRGVESCRQLAAAVKALDAVLGPDFASGGRVKESRVGKLAEAGGKTVVNSLIPFRGLVRELSGAAPAQRRLEAATYVGYARRGFLRGVHQARGCRTR